MSHPYDVVAVGELLIDLIGETPAEALGQTERFARHQGGSPANLAKTLTLAGVKAALVACVGDDSLGRYAVEQLAKAGVPTDPIAVTPSSPTSVVMVSRTSGTPDFTAYRHADALIEPSHVTAPLAKGCRIYHTTCFALSRPPARNAVIDGAERAVEAGATLSLDANYAAPIWPDRREAHLVLQQFCSLAPLVKVSEDDVSRLFGTNTSIDTGIQQFHDWGADTVCATLGPEGSRVSWDGGAQVEEVPPVDVEVVDATGAGDAFWAGYLAAHLRSRTPPACAQTGARVAAQKLAQAGPLTERLPDSVFD